MITAMFIMIKGFAHHDQRFCSSLHDRDWKITIDLSLFIGKLLCLAVSNDKKHCRLINVQNPLPKLRQKKNKGQVENDEDDEDDEDVSKYAEPNSCRKVPVSRHYRDQCEKFDVSLEDLKTKSKDGILLNQQLAISHSTSYVPILKTNKNMVQMIYLCCNYSLKHGVNPISDRTINLDPRSIKKEIKNLCQTYRSEIIFMITDRLEEEDQHLKMLRETKETIPLEDRMPKKMLIIGLQSDHARLQHKNIGAIDMAIKELNIETMETKSYCLPFQTYQVADRKGKDSDSNISHLKEFLKSNFEKEQITKISLCGDGGLVTSKFCQLLRSDDCLGHLAIYSGKCTNHADGLQLKWANYRLLNDLDLAFKKLFPNRTISNGRKVVFFGDQTDCTSFRRDFHYLLELIQCQGNYEDDNVNIIKFGDQMKALQLEFVKNEFHKLSADEKNAALPKLKNPLVIRDFEFYRAEFFKDNSMEIKQQIFTVKPTCDTKQRRLPEQLMAMAATANYAQAIVDRGKFKKSFTRDSFMNEGDTVPSRLSVGFIKKVHEFCAAVGYTKSKADSNRDSENMPFIRLVFISVKIACRFDTNGQKLPLSNEFLT